MSPSPVTAERRIAVIASADLAGYSRLSERDEPAAFTRVVDMRAQAREVLASRGGRIFNTAGDGLMIEFASASGALEAAIELLADISDLRLGLHLGEVALAEGGDLLGHGVNVAARLQQAAPRNGALVSADLQRAIRGPLAQRLVRRGPMRLDKMDETVDVFALAAPPPGTDGAPGLKPQLAVLAFDNLSGDPDMVYFSDGLSEEILQAITANCSIQTMARSSSFQFRGAEKRVANIAQWLRATHILDGSVRRSGSRVRITAQLIECASQAVIWSERFDRELSDVFALQDEIALAVATAMNATFTSAGPQAPIDPTAYDLYLRAGWPPHKPPHELRAGIALLEAAVERAPDFTLARGRLACFQGWLMQYASGAEVDALHAAAEANARATLAAVPNEPGAAMAMLALAKETWDHCERERWAKAAVQGGASGIGLAGYAVFLLDVGRQRDSVEAAQQHFRNHPGRAPDAQLVGWTLLHSGRLAEARAVMEDALARWPDAERIAGNLVVCAARQGDWARVDEMMAPDRLARFPFGELEQIMRSVIPILRGEPEARAAPIAAARAMFERSGRAFSETLAYAAHCGDLDEALEIGRKADFTPSARLRAWRGDIARYLAPLFDVGLPEIRQDPRFVEICARVGLVDYWRRTDAWPDCVDEVPYDFRAACAKL